jgi:hypothetical protein
MRDRTVPGPAALPTGRGVVRTSISTLVSDIDFTTDVVRFKIILDAVTIAIKAAEAARAAAFNAGINAEAARVAFSRVHHSPPNSNSDSDRSDNNRSMDYYANQRCNSLWMHDTSSDDDIPELLLGDPHMLHVTDPTAI